MSEHAPGTPGARLDSLFAELDKRFPRAKDFQFASDPPEPKYLAEIDNLREALRVIIVLDNDPEPGLASWNIARVDAHKKAELLLGIKS